MSINPVSPPWRSANTEILSAQFTFRQKFALLVIPTLIIALRLTPGRLSLLAYFLVASYSLLGRRQAVVSLLLLCLLNITSHAISPPPQEATYIRHVIIFIAAFSTLALHNRSGFTMRSATPLLSSTLVVFGILAIHAVAISQLPLVSFLKTLSFSLSVVTLLAGWGGLSLRERRTCEFQFWAVSSLMFVLCIPLAFTTVGYKGGFAGFQGVFYQPQTLGIIAAAYGAPLLVSAFLNRGVSTVALRVAGASIAAAFIYLSRARVGALGFSCGVAAGLLSAAATTLLTRYHIHLRLRPARLVLAGALIAASILVFGPVLFSRAQQFLIKDASSSGGSISIVDSLYLSRAAVIEVMYRNINRRPLTGVGFGVPTEGTRSTEVITDPVFGLPIMATVEKGILPIAIVEELGYPIAIVVLTWIAWLLVRSLRGGPTEFSASVAALSVTIGEAVLFSPGGPGLYLLVILCMAVTAVESSGGMSYERTVARRRSLTRAANAPYERELISGGRRVLQAWSGSDHH